MKVIEVKSASQLDWLQHSPPNFVALDTEYTELNIRKAELLSSSLTPDGETAFIIPKIHTPSLRALRNCRALFFQNHKVDQYMLKKTGVDLMDIPFYDLMLLDHLIDENREHGLGPMVLREVNDNYKEEFWQQYSNFEDAPIGEQLQYQAKDVIYLYRILLQHLDRLKDVPELIEHVHNLSKSLMYTEFNGIKVNVPLMLNTKHSMKCKIDSYKDDLLVKFKEYTDTWELEEWTKQIDKRKSEKGKQRVSRPQFNFASDTQVGWLIYDALNLPVIEKTKKRNPSTSYDTLLKLSEENPIIKTIVDYKEEKAVYSTFVEGMLERIEDNDRIYPGFNINGTHTGRISHKNPNMGNLPTTGVIRNFFIPDEGNVIFGADYSQLEIIVEANLTEDGQLLKIVNEGASKHDITAEGLGITRDVAKRVNFACQYGAQAYKLSKILDIPIHEAEQVYNQYWRLYIGVKRLKDETEAKVERGLPIINIFGRERHFPNTFQNKYELARAQRQAYNFLIQGPGADITNRAYYLFNRYMQNTSNGRTWFSVHDEIVAECKEVNVEEYKTELVQTMINVTDYVKFKYPLQAVAYGPLKYWGKE